MERGGVFENSFDNSEFSSATLPEEGVRPVKQVEALFMVCGFDEVAT